MHSSTCQTRQQQCLRATHFILCKEQAAFDMPSATTMLPSQQHITREMSRGFPVVTIAEQHSKFASWFKRVKQRVRVQRKLPHTL